MLLYTSVSAGQPKGLMQTFGAITAVAQGIVEDFAERGVGKLGDDRMVSYLAAGPLLRARMAWI